jgi:hypothetical protein
MDEKEDLLKEYHKLFQRKMKLEKRMRDINDRLFEIDKAEASKGHLIDRDNMEMIWAN